ncbi:hypothetical protein BS47DRAFT_1389292 [Hydnum rufescens UP504]|uniref:Uncharacterized protein n=1 Tax=Hydnum rufescens UP504 TaxID=1448309 RepID=A0A9P6B5N6_9AGAM|nr:hypothetical protein BS47DRAFT_1389292 [Hydnum rufescens UP504]
MIITENDPKAALKALDRSQSPHSHLLSSSSSTTSFSPPAYERVPSLPSDVLGPSPQVLNPSAPKGGSRGGTVLVGFFKAFLVASIFWLLMTAFARSIIELSFRGFHDGKAVWGEPLKPQSEDGQIPDSHDCEPDFWGMQPVSSPYDNGRVGQEPLSLGSQESVSQLSSPGPGPRNPKYVYHARYILPATSAQTLYMVARGNHSEGDVFFEPVTGAEEIVVAVKVSHPDDGMQKRIKLCRLQRDGNAEGFGIFTSEERWGWVPHDRRKLHVEVHVRVPVGPSSSLLALESYLPNYSQHFGLFAEDAYFNSLTIRGTDGELYADALAGHNITFQTTNGKIGGHFETDTALTLETSNGRIEVDVDAQNAPTQPLSTSVSLITSNGPILSTLSLSTVRSGDRSYPGEGGSFSAYARTTNGIFNLKVPITPLSPTIIIDGNTTNNRASLSMYRAYEGSFMLNSSNAVESPRRRSDSR